MHSAPPPSLWPLSKLQMSPICLAHRLPGALPDGQAASQLGASTVLVGATAAARSGTDRSITATDPPLARSKVPRGSGDVSLSDAPQRLPRLRMAGLRRQVVVEARPTGAAIQPDAALQHGTEIERRCGIAACRRQPPQ